MVLIQKWHSDNDSIGTEHARRSVKSLPQFCIDAFEVLIQALHKNTLRLGPLPDAK